MQKISKKSTFLQWIFQQAMFLFKKYKFLTLVRALDGSFSLFIQTHPFFFFCLPGTEASSHSIFVVSLEWSGGFLQGQVQTQA